MPLDRILLRKSESPLAMVAHRKPPASSIFSKAPLLTSKEATRSCAFLMASNKGVFPKLSMKKIISISITIIWLKQLNKTSEQKDNHLKYWHPHLLVWGKLQYLQILSLMQDAVQKRSSLQADATIFFPLSNDILLHIREVKNKKQHHYIIIQ